MIAEIGHGVANASLQRIADRTAPAGIGTIDHQLQTAFFNGAIEIEIGDARLDQSEGTGFIKLDHLVHALQIDNDAAGHIGRRATITEILSGRDRKQRNAIFAGDAHNGLHLRNVGRRHRS